MSEFDEFVNSDEEYQDGDSDNLVLDLDDVSAEMPEFEAIPAGVYDATVDNTEYKVSANRNPMIVWTFRIIDEAYKNRVLFYHTILNKEAGLARLKRLLVRLMPDTNFKEFKPKQFCEEGVALGLPCRVKIRIRPYQGKRVNDVTDVLPAKSEESFL